MNKYFKYVLIVPFCYFLFRADAAIEKRKNICICKDVACSIRPRVIWSISSISTYNELDKTDILHCMFTKKLVFKMLLFTVLLVNVAFGAGKLSVSNFIPCRYLEVYFTQK